MSEKFILYCRKIMNNPLLKRKQLQIELIHPDQGSVSKTSIKTKIATMLKAKEEQISVYGVKAKFGGGRSTGFAFVYDSLDARKKFDQKTLLRRDKVIEVAARKGRKQVKEMKSRMKKVRGTAKAKAANATAKKGGKK
jgi:small subunit ribosomal protein S24e